MATRAMTTYGHRNSGTWAPHLTAETTQVDGATVPVATYHDLVAYVREIECHERGNAGLVADDLDERASGLTLYMHDVGAAQSYPVIGRTAEGRATYAISGWPWFDYDGPCDRNDCR